jgi:hypothetical protein
MLNKSLFLAVMLIFMSSAVSFANTEARDLFQQLREKTFARLPDKFTARLSGRSIDEKLESIPKDYIEEGKSAFAQLEFSKENGISIKVKNVDFLYEDLFEQYVRFFSLGPVLSTRMDSSMLDRYDINFAGDSPGNRSILDVKFRNAQNKFLFYLALENFDIMRVDYLIEDRLLSSTLIRYKDHKVGNKTYRIPDRFIVRTPEAAQGRPEYFDVSDIRFD